MHVFRKMSHFSVTITHAHNRLGCASFTGGYGLQTYRVTVTTSDGRLTALPAYVTTEPGRKWIKLTV